VAVFASIGLIMLMARRMGLPLGMCALAAAAVALSPLTQYLHGVGFVDHHFAEYILVLLSIVLGLRWLEDGQPRSAAFLGLALGLAPGVHNALFILQIPLLICLGVRWLLDQRTSPVATGYFCLALIAATLAMLLPSIPFQQGRFEYFYLSWFHLYVACGTAVFSILFSRLGRRTVDIAILIGTGIVLLVPLTYQIVAAESFLTGKILRLDSIAEMKSPLRFLAESGVGYMSRRYSLLFWLLPLSYVLCVFKVWQERRSHRLYYWVSAVLGASLLMLQFRLHYFGTFALCIPLLVVVLELAAKWEPARRYAMLSAASVVLAMFIPPMRYQLLGPMVPANDPSFINLYRSLQVLADSCRSDPGVVLADNDIGHYIRYFTDCSVIADNFLLTQQHESKIREMERLFVMHAAELPQAAPFVKYVFIRPLLVRLTGQGVTYMAYGGGENNLIADLLLRPFGTPSIAPPSAFELVYSTAVVDTENIEVPYLALYKIRRDISTMAREQHH
jgi:hypothetical protein